MMRCLPLLAVVACSSSSSDSAPPSPKPGEAAPPVQRPPADKLEKGVPVEKAIKATETHRYRIELPAGHIARGVVMQKGIDLMLVTYDPSGKKLAEYDSPNGTGGPEPFVIEATVAGGYDLEVKPFAEPGAAATRIEQGRYEGKLDEILTADAYAELSAKERIASPRVMELWRAVRAKNTAEADRWWARLQGASPIVEPYPGDDKLVLVSFVLRSKTPYVGLIGGPEFREKPMVRVGDSDFWYLTARMPADSRFDYAFMAADGPAEYFIPWKKDRAPDPRWAKKQTDPNNKLTRFDMSRAELPGAPAQPYIAVKPDVAKGKMTEVTIESAKLKQPRKLGVYTPAGYDAKAKYPLVIAFDGEIYGLTDTPLLPLPTILDNMTAAKQIPPVVLVLVANQGIRDRDLPGSPAFASFIAEELVPKMRADYRAGTTAADTLVTGSSFGGVASMYIGLHHSDVVGKVLAQSSAFGYKHDSIDKDVSDLVEGGWLMRDFAASPKLPLRIYLDAGRFETPGLLEPNRHMRDVLIAKGYPLTYVEFSGGHDYWEWRGTISTGLVALLAK